MQKRFKANSVLLGLFLLCAVLLSGCSKEDKKTTETPLRAVRTIVVNADIGSRSRTFSGTLHAAQETKLSFKVAGSIQDIVVNVGDQVKKGEMIARLDSMPYDLQAQQANAALIRAQAELRNADSNYGRAKSLYVGGNASKNELDNARASSESAAASVQSSRKALEIARLNVSYTKLRIEENCAIASVDAEEGENVASGTQIFRATCGDELEVKLDIPETVIGYIKKNMPVDVRFSALKGRRYNATVTEVGVSAVGSGTTFPVTVVLSQDDVENLKPGLSADVVFSFENHRNAQQAILVPSFALGEDEAGRFVFILDNLASGRATVRRQSVTVGNILQSGIEVLSGLKAGDRVVTAGISVLHNGMDVKYFDE